MVEPDAVRQGRERVAHLLAQGGMADVFRARDTTLGRDVAVKVFRVGAGAYAGSTMRLGSSPPLITEPRPVLDAGDHQGQPYVVFELVAGPTLAHRLADGPLSDGEARPGRG